MTNEEYIRQHRLDDVRKLALRKAVEGVDIKWCLQQIEGWQKAKEKLPLWAKTEGLWYPVALSMEQCSSESTANYKRAIVERILADEDRCYGYADLTGGYGIDFSYISPLFSESCYVERNTELCRIAEHNFNLLHLEGVTVVCADSTEFFCCGDRRFTMLYLDPARRDGIGRKTVAIDDCTPDILTIQDRLLARSRWVMIKLSPMLDINTALKVIKCVKEIHAVSVRGECKELLFLLQSGYDGMPGFVAANLDSTDREFVCDYSGRVETKPLLKTCAAKELVGKILYEPNASILKLGVQDALCAKLGVCKLHPMSNLFVSDASIKGFPGRVFEIANTCGFGKKELRDMLGDVSKANITIRNFPTDVAQLRKKLRLAEGGDVYLFATTLADGSHVLLRCRK